MAGRRQTSAKPQHESDSSSTQTLERRRRLALRALVEEMLSGIRSAAAEEDWTPEERSRAEADLARIMDQVRREAFRNSPAE
jgi:hypothetical protein